MADRQFMTEFGVSADWVAGGSQPGALPPDAPPHAQDPTADLLASGRAERNAAEAAQRWFESFLATSGEAMSPAALDELVKDAFSAIAESLGADGVSLLVTDEEGAALVGRAAYGWSVESRPPVYIPFGRGVSGSVAVQRRPLIVPELDDVEVASETLRATGFHSYVGVPMLAGDSVVGVLHATSFRPNRFEPRHAVALSAVAGPLAAAVERVRRVEAERRARKVAEEAAGRLAHEARTLRFLLDATTVLSSSLDYHQSLEELARLAVPVLGDLCLIDVLVDGSIVRMAVAHADPGRRELADRLWNFPPESGGDHPAVSVMRMGQSMIAPEMTEEFLRATSHDEDHFTILKELGFMSYLCAPLKTRGRVLGSVTLVSAGSARRFDENDLALAEDLAQRAALVIDNARLYSERARIAQALQASLLPPRLPTVPGLELAARYRASGETNDVGGDFYDLFDLGRGSWAAAVGDVCGRGPEAAAVTGLVRHSLHTSAQRASDPAAMLEDANAVLSEDTHVDQERFCSVACAVVTPGRCTQVVIASAGHPPPFVLRKDGTLEKHVGGGPALGIVPKLGLEARTVLLSPGELIFFYTDGLTEARDEAGRFFGETALCEALGGCAGLGAEAVATTMLCTVEDFSAGHLRDDLALLVVRAEG